MNTTKINPFFKGQTFSSLVDDLFTKGLSDWNGSEFAVSNPSVNISENETAFMLELAAPGLDKKDFKIQIEKDQLIISAEKESSAEEKEEGKWNRKEFNFGSFRRQFYLSDSVNTDKISAEYQNGVLTLELPKKDEAKAKAAKNIEIK